jgi:Mn-dependent DtxR family transcriptional regulator
MLDSSFREHIPEDVRRFILTSIDSVPYLEALLLLRNAPDQSWDSVRVAQRLYVSEKVATELLSELSVAGFVAITEPETSYRYHPSSDELRLIINQLAEMYAKNLVEVTNLVHSKIGKRAKQFADAFKWRKDS